MQTANFNDSQFVDALSLSTGAQAATASITQHGKGLHKPGLTGNSSLVLSYSGLVVTAQVNGVNFLFQDGTQCQGIGNTAGASNTSYVINFASLVPATGTVTVYLAATKSQVQQTPLQIVGPPVSHPDYDPTFAPYTGYRTVVDSVTITATTVAPNGLTTLELARGTLSAGQTTITAMDTSHQNFASAILNPTGVAAAAYTTPNLTIGADGRITAATSTGPFVHQGDGVGQLANQIHIGWTSASKLALTVDVSNIGNFAMEPWVTTNFLNLATGGTVLGNITSSGTPTLSYHQVAVGAGGLTVSGTSTFSGAVTAGTIHATGAVQFDSTATVNGNFTVGGGASIGGNSIELGSRATVGPAFVDFHSDGGNTDYNARILVQNGTVGVLGTADMTFTAGSYTFGGGQLHINDTSGSNTGSLSVTNTAGDGATLKMTGNGATTPSKFLRVLSGQAQWVSSDYTRQLWSLDDSGNESVTGNLSAGGTLSVAGTSTLHTVNTGNLAVSGNATIAGTTHGTGTATFDGAVNVGGGLGVSGTVATLGNIELGSTSVAKAAFLDFHTDGTGTDYNARILAIGGTAGVIGSADLQFTAVNVTFSVSNFAITSGLTVTGGSNLNGGIGTSFINATGNIGTNGALTVQGTTTLNGLVNINDNVGITGIVNIVDTSGADLETLHVTNTGTNGVSLMLTGNGSVTPNKFLRVTGGLVQWLSSDYTRSLWQLSDAGNEQLTGSSTILGGLTVAGGSNLNGGIGTSFINASAGVTAASLAVTGSALLSGTSASSLHVSGNVQLDTTMGVTGNVVLGGTVTCNNTVTTPHLSTPFVSSASALNIGGQLVQITNAAGSALGALNVSNGLTGNQAVSIAQFEFSPGNGSAGIAGFPSGSGLGVMVQIQFGTIQVVGDNTNQFFNFLTTFPTTCLAVVISYGSEGIPPNGSVGAETHGNAGFNAASSAGAGFTNGCYYMAIGY